jgi:hypothetical protein
MTQEQYEYMKGFYPKGTSYKTILRLYKMWSKL